MNLITAQAKALVLMNKHGLSDWTFQWDRKKTGFGFCRPSTKTISLSAPLTKINSDEEVVDTILHEISHALDWVRNKKMGHDWSWKKICIEVGCRPEQYFSEKNVVMDKPLYTVRNITTGSIISKYYRLPTKGVGANYDLLDVNGMVIKPSYVLKNSVTGKLVTKYYSYPSKVHKIQHLYFEKGMPSTKGQLKLYNVNSIA